MQAQRQRVARWSSAVVDQFRVQLDIQHRQPAPRKGTRNLPDVRRTAFQHHLVLRDRSIGRLVHIHQNPPMRQQHRCPVKRPKTVGEMSPTVSPATMESSGAHVWVIHPATSRMVSCALSFRRVAAFMSNFAEGLPDFIHERCRLSRGAQRITIRRAARARLARNRLA